MSVRYIEGTRIRGLSKLEGLDLTRIEVGIPVNNDEDKLIGLYEIGDLILPRGEYGPISRRNAYGYTYPDKTKSKENRWVSTNWIQPFGNENASSVPVDIERKCYPKIEVPPYEIELLLYADDSDRRFILVNMTDHIRTHLLKEAVNLMLEIFGSCYIFEGEIKLGIGIKKSRRNWEFLPPGERPSRYLEKQLENAGVTKNTFDVFRLKYIEDYAFEEVVEGINGFNGYFAYLFKNHCVFESAIYGNATYIIPRENWELLSQLSKKELFDEGKVERKVIHTRCWEKIIDGVFSEFGIKSGSK